MGIEYLKALVIIFGVSAVVVFILGRLKISSVVGFLIAGVILGPYGFELIRNIHEVELLAEIGVILLMFTIGLEFSLRNLMAMRREVLAGGSLQVLLTIGIVAFLANVVFGQDFNMAVFGGFLVALSSTAIVMKLLFDTAEINSPQGRMTIGILIFQDLCVVPFMLFVPLLAGVGGGAAGIALTMFKAFIVVAVVIVAARWAVPQALHQIVGARSRELFVISIIVLCIGTAFLTSKLGLSLALGAFLAGIIISDSEYASQATADILPFKESFIGLFFISAGMLMNTDFIVDNSLTVIIVVCAIILLKVLTGMVSAFIAGKSVRVSMQAGLYLAQIGEFSFVLALAGRSHGLLTEYAYQLFLSASVLTMLLTPFISRASYSLPARIGSKSLMSRLERLGRSAETEAFPAAMTGHVIVIGFGINGSNVARVLKASGIPYVVLEMNANTVRNMRKIGEPIYYGDGTSVEILHKIGVNNAKVLVIAISDAAATRRVTQIARLENPGIHIVVRTRYMAEVDDLVKLGADEVIPEEFETSVEIFSRVLHHYHMPKNMITEHIENIRKDNYKVFRSTSLPEKHLAERHEFLKDIETETFLIKEGFSGCGKSLKDMNLRAQTGVTAIAVQRGEGIYQNPAPGFVLNPGDIVLLIGKRKDINIAVKYLEHGALSNK